MTTVSREQIDTAVAAYIAPYLGTDLGSANCIKDVRINADRVEYNNGMNVVVCTTAPTDEQARELLRLMGFPFRDHDVVVLGKVAGEEGEA